MHHGNSPLRPGGRGGAAVDVAYDNDKASKEARNNSLGMKAFIAGFVLVIIGFGFILKELVSLTNTKTKHDKLRVGRETAGEDFWESYIGKHAPFKQAIGNRQFIVERGRARHWGNAHNVKECAEKCVEDAECTAFSFVERHARAGLREAAPGRCITLGGTFETRPLKHATVFPRNIKRETIADAVRNLDAGIANKLRDAPVNAA